MMIQIQEEDYDWMIDKFDNFVSNWDIYSLGKVREKVEMCTKRWI